MIGQSISHYRIIEKLGEGGMGVVYRAEDTRLGRTVALKFLPRELTTDPDARDRFLREARAISAIEHPNICTIHEVDETADGRTFICMACYDGRSLKDRLVEGPVPLGEALSIAMEVSRGLLAAHAAGIVHRDVKPGNIMLTAAGGVRIIDFGLAKLASQASLTASGSALGTVAYMSPEQATGGAVDLRTDVWSLGVVLYEMVAGRRPFQGEYHQAVIYSILQETPEPLGRIQAGLPPELDRIVEKALEKDPAKRYSDVGAMLEDMKTLSAALDAAKRETRHVWRFGTRYDRIVRTALALAVIVAVAIAVPLLVRRGGEGRFVPAGRPLQVTGGLGWEGQPAISPDGTRIAYVSDESGNYDIYVADIHGGTTLRLTDDPAMDCAPTWFPDGTSLAFASGRGGSLDVWKVGQFGGGATLLVEDADTPAVSPDGSRIAFSRADASGLGRIYVAPLSSPREATCLSGGGHGLWGDWGPAWSPDGRTICYATRHNLWTVPADGGSPSPLTSVGEGDSDPAWSSDGRHVYFSSDRGGTSALWRVSRNGGVPERLTTGAGFEGDPSVAKDGSRLAYSSSTMETHFLIQDRRSGLETELPPLKGASMAAFYPDGHRIVVASRSWGANTELGELLLDDGRTSGAPRRLTDQPGDASHPSVSPDGNWIAYYRIIGDERDIWIIPAQGGRPTRLIESPASDIHPAWSPDGSMLAFVSDREGVSDIWIVPIANGAATGEPRRVTRSTVAALAPCWSPDGRSIAFIGSDRDGNNVWIVPADGSEPERQITRGLSAQRVRWDPVGGQLLVSAAGQENDVVLWSLSPQGGVLAKATPAVLFGPPSATAIFDVSRDGSLLLFQRQFERGSVWVLEEQRGTY
jgi:Tol biopolymer transport system component